MTLSIQPGGAIAAGVHHTFNEAKLADVSASMATMDEAAYAEFDLQMGFAHSNGTITRVDLTMTLTIDMPVWSKAGSARKPEQDEWNRFLLALRAHEDGHIAICRREAPVAYDKLLKSAPSTINDVLERERARIKRLNDVYDHQTDHGRTQNTAHGNTVIVLPP
jgi:predicted secreted Zn-dependent protease